MSNLIRKINKVLADPGIIPLIFIPKRFLSDRNFLRYKYCRMTGLKLNLKKPVLFNEKLQWLKLNDRKEEYRILSDKYEARKYIAQTIGEEYLIPLYGVWDRFEDIPFDTLPNEFVLKCNHDSGTILICRDKQSLDMERTRAFFNKRLDRDYYFISREWCYKGIKPRIIAEKLMVDESGIGLKDYKIFCFNGEPKIIEVDIGRFINHERNFYSPQWEYQYFVNDKPNANPDAIEKPVSLDLMLDIARKLSASKYHLRVDLYNVNDKVYCGELTFYDGGGFNSYEPPEWNKIFGNWMKLPCD